MKVSNSSDYLLRIYQDRLDQSQQTDQSQRADVPGAVSERTQKTQREPGAVQDTVELSDYAQMLERIRQEVDAAEVTPAERLAQLQQQVQSDTYQVPLAQLTMRLLSGDIF